MSIECYHLRRRLSCAAAHPLPRACSRRLLETLKVGLGLDDAGLGNLRWAFRAAFALEPTDEVGRTADPAGARLLDVAANRIPDGRLLYGAFAPALREGSDLPDVTGVGTGDAEGVKKAAALWLAWCDTTLAEAGTTDAWQPATLDYSFEVATGARNSTVATVTAV